MLAAARAWRPLQKFKPASTVGGGGEGGGPRGASEDPVYHDESQDGRRVWNVNTRLWASHCLANALWPTLLEVLLLSNFGLCPKNLLGFDKGY